MGTAKTISQIIATMMLAVCILGIITLVCIAWCLERYIRSNRQISNEIARQIRRVY